MPWLPQLSNTFQVGIQPHQQFLYYNTQPSQNSQMLYSQGLLSNENNQMASKVSNDQAAHLQDKHFQTTQ
ncbi:hypothetical protein ACP70R_007439 [Stipagrostis hirtigluma subsp. patula]